MWPGGMCAPSARTAPAASIELGGVADRGVAFDDRREILRAVDDGVVLHVRTVADLDLRLVRAQHSAKPHAGAGFDLNVADEHRGGCDVRVGVHLRALAAELVFHWPL